MVRHIVAIAAVVSTATWTLALAQCPPNYRGGYFSGPGDTPIYQAVHRDSSCISPETCLSRAHWDLTEGTAYCDALSPCFTELGPFGDVGIFLNDDYVLTGPSSPTPVAFQAVMHVSGSAGASFGATCSSGRIKAALQEGAQTSSAEASASCPPPTGAGLDTDLQLSLAKSVGEHFQLAMSLGAIAACFQPSTLASRLTFLLPPGYGVTSCYGFIMPAATDVARASWGRVKMLYR